MPPRLPGYVVEELLGAGSSGEVWAARIADTGEPVALKVVRLDGAAARERAVAEAAALTALDHPHLVRLHGVVEARDALVLVLDLAAGGSLADVLRRRAPITAGEVVTAVAPVGAALAHAHAHAVVHGDVSPANILFTPIGLPMLADLGLSRLVGERPEGPADRAVTPGYVDPIVARGSPVGTASDVFSLGAVALHALTGRGPWELPGPAASAEVLLERAAAADFGTGGLAARLAGVDAAVAAIVAAALAPDPADRPSAAEFALDLRCACPPAPVDLLAGRVLPAAGPDRRPRPGPRHARPPGSQRAGAAATAGRPDFSRPGTARLPDGVGGGLTHELRPPDRPRLPAQRRGGWRGRWRGGWRGRYAHPRLPLLGVVLLAAGVLAIGAAVLLRRPAGAAPPRTAPAGSITERVTAELDRLDALRGQAFAERRPDLLAEVYAPGPLLAADRDLLARTVPAGCGLSGVRTAYAVSGVRQDADGSVSVTAAATLAPSVLRCPAGGPGAPTASVPGAGPSVLLIRLSPAADGSAGVRISDQRAG